MTDRSTRPGPDDPVDAAERDRARAIEAAIADRTGDLDPSNGGQDGRLDTDGEIAFGRKLNASLHAVFDPILDEPVPAAFLRPAGRRPMWRGVGLRIAAGVALLAVGVGAGWLLRGGVPGAGSTDASLQFTTDAHRAHVIYVAERRHAVEVAASEDHLFRWLSARLGGDIVAPSLGDFGFTLLGGRLLPQDDRVAAQFMYQDAQERRLTLYITAFADLQATEVQVRAFDDSSALYWTDGDFGFAMIGDLPRDQLIDIANAAFQALDSDP